VEPALLANKDSNAPANSLVLLATVKGDLHDLGKNMVGAMLRTSGFDVHDLGKDVGADAII
jgi:5-methyltetrahydrofolate--homocysteine methyltransferase